ncbi:MAG: nitrite/sulfite reductase [Chloroflexi bacterium]|nr:nitrite/sulfite reductase [Chloroflexota bacterium]
MSSENNGENAHLGSTTVAIRNLEGQLLRLRQGEITNDEFLPNRTILGAYGQRQPEEYMVRVRIPYGSLTGEQLRCLADVARNYGNGVAHVTTRQNMQLHWLKLDKIPEILWRLAAVGLTTLQSGGNSVRTVAACPLAGVCGKEAFDVTPYAAALDNFYLGNDAVTHLPRKFKMAVSGCSSDCAYSRIQDFGAVAEVRKENGTAAKGFRVYIGGGLGVFPRLAQPLDGFVPEEELLPTCEAMVRLFDQLGDRKNKQKARLKFVLLRLGVEEMRRLVKEEREKLRAEGKAFPRLAVDNIPYALPSLQPGQNRQPLPDPEYQRWRYSNTVLQRQEGRWAVFIPLVLGDITSAQMETVADVADRYGEGILRTSQQQDLVLREVSENVLLNVYEALRDSGLSNIKVLGIADVVSCPGTSACSLGITASKGLARQLTQMLETYQDDNVVGSIRIKVSGCPDSCGQHQLADIGLCGCALHSGGRLYPAYQVFLGGEVTDQGTKLARPIVKIPARKVPQAIRRLLDFCREQWSPQERFSTFVDRLGIEAFRQLLTDFTIVPAPTKDVWNFIDWDSTRMYILERGEGECAI